MSLFQSTYKASEANYAPDHIYLNGSLYNDNYTNTSLSQYVPAEIGQTRNSPFLDNCSAYNMSIIRFAISADCIPRVFQPLNTTTLNTDWWVSLSYNGVFYDSPIVLPTIIDPQGNQAKINYSIQAFLDYINIAWKVSQDAVVAAGFPAPGDGQIFINLDNVTGFYNVNVPIWYGTGIEANVPADGIGVHMSLALYQMFGSFNATVPRGPQITYNHHEVTFVREVVGYNLTTTAYSTFTPIADYFQLKQDAARPSSVMNVHRLLITTSTLPVYSEFSAPLFTSNNTSGGNNITKLVTDFYIGHDGVLENDNQTVVYVPNIYRLISLTGATPLSNWDFKIFYETTDNQIFPLYIPPYGEIDLKVLFLKKGLTS